MPGYIENRNPMLEERPLPFWDGALVLKRQHGNACRAYQSEYNLSLDREDENKEIQLPQNFYEYYNGPGELNRIDWIKEDHSGKVTYTVQNLIEKGDSRTPLSLNTLELTDESILWKFKRNSLEGDLSYGTYQLTFLSNELYIVNKTASKVQVVFLNTLRKILEPGETCGFFFDSNDAKVMLQNRNQPYVQLTVLDHSEQKECVLS